MQVTTDSLPMVDDGLPPVTAASVRAAKDDALRQLRESARVIAARHGHVLGTWRESLDEGEVAYCRGCWRAAAIDVVREPHLAGQALREPCGPIQTRPDAFLANQHESEIRRGGR